MWTRIVHQGSQEETLHYEYERAEDNSHEWWEITLEIWDYQRVFSTVK
jgi:hypothetical protein